MASATIIVTAAIERATTAVTTSVLRTIRGAATADTTVAATTATARVTIETNGATTVTRHSAAAVTDATTHATTGPLGTIATQEDRAATETNVSKAETAVTSDAKIRGEERAITTGTADATRAGLLKVAESNSI